MQAVSDSCEWKPGPCRPGRFDSGGSAIFPSRRLLKGLGSAGRWFPCRAQRAVQVSTEQVRRQSVSPNTSAAPAVFLHILRVAFREDVHSGCSVTPPSVSGPPETAQPFLAHCASSAAAAQAASRCISAGAITARLTSQPSESYFC